MREVLAKPADTLDSRLEGLTDPRTCTPSLRTLINSGGGSTPEFPLHPSRWNAKIIRCFLLTHTLAIIVHTHRRR